jgi:hypothetical protein
VHGWPLRGTSRKLGAMRRKWRVLPVAVLAILVAVNAYLISQLLQSQRQVTAEPTGQLTISSNSPVESAATTPSEEATPYVSPDPSSSSTAATYQEVAVSTRLLVATSKKQAWRATVGDCKKIGRVERSANGGKSWRQAVKPALGPLVRLGVEPNGDLYVLGGTGKDCSIRYIAYSTNGVIAGQTDLPQRMWSRDPKDPDRIQGPGSAKATPCKSQHVLGLASLSTSEALIICTRGSAMVTSDSGESWKEAGELVGTMAVGAGGGRFWVAGKGENCDGIAIRSLSLTGGRLSTSGNLCAADLPLIPGRIAIDVAGRAIWLWAGDKVQVSTDGGRSWKSHRA